MRMHDRQLSLGSLAAGGVFGLLFSILRRFAGPLFLIFLGLLADGGLRIAFFFVAGVLIVRRVLRGRSDDPASLFGRIGIGRWVILGWWPVTVPVLLLILALVSWSWFSVVLVLAAVGVVVLGRQRRWFVMAARWRRRWTLRRVIEGSLDVPGYAVSWGLMDPVTRVVPAVLSVDLVAGGEEIRLMFPPGVSWDSLDPAAAARDLGAIGGEWLVGIDSDPSVVRLLIIFEDATAQAHEADFMGSAGDVQDVSDVLAADLHSQPRWWDQDDAATEVGGDGDDDSDVRDHS